MNEFEELADQVLAIDASKKRSDIIVDLKYTKSAEVTLNRIFDGTFLNGTDRDPSIKQAFIILDSDDEDNTTVDINSIVSQSTPVTRPAPILLQDSSEVDILRSPVQDLLARNSPIPNEITSPELLLDDPTFSINEEEVRPGNDQDDIFSMNHSSLSIDNEPSSMLSLEQEFNVSVDDSLKKKQESDSDDVVSLPSMSDFFDELMSQKRDTPVFEIDDEEEEVIVDIKGKGKANDDISWDEDKTLTVKERKKREAEERKRKRAEEAEEKKRAKARLAEEKKRLKDQKEFERQRAALFEKENRLRTNRTDILKEMIVDIHPEFLKTQSGKLAEALFMRKDVEMHDLLLQQPSPLHTISWRRKCNSEWNQDTQTFIPLPAKKITAENVVLVHLYTHEFIEKIPTIDAYIDRIAYKNPNCQIMLMLEGVESYYRKKKLSQRRQFDAQVRNAIQPSSSSQSIRSKDNFYDAPEQAEVEECLNYLQIMRDVMLVLTKDEEDTASWIESLTIDLGLARYKKNANNSYKVSKCGTDPQDMYFKMLQEVQLCTPAVAKSIIYSYPTVQSLYQAYKNTSKAEGELLLADLSVERSALHVRDRKINRVMSKKIYNIFTCDDPEKILY